MLRFAHGLRRLVRFGAWLFVLTFLGVSAWTFLWPMRDSRDVARADAIICLGAGMDEQGVLDPASLSRVARCVELHEAGVAPIVVFSGGPAVPGGVSAGTQMARAAQAMLFPPEAGLIEGQAHSTLQNAVFSLPMVPGAERLVLVTEAFHLPRAWASFKWAGAPALDLVAVGPVRRTDSDIPNWGMLLREAAAIWFNSGRAAAFSAGAALGTPEAERMGWLR